MFANRLPLEKNGLYDLIFFKKLFRFVILKKTISKSKDYVYKIFDLTNEKIEIESLKDLWKKKGS